MAKNCSICGKKLKMLDGKITISDGLVCNSCWSSAGFDMSMKSISKAHNKTCRQIRDLIEIAILKQEAEKERLRREAGIGSPAIPSTLPAGAVGKPIDIFINVNQQMGVSLVCNGGPTINFFDLVNGKEMIIGDGYIKNESKLDLPDIRIACEFEPPIIDSGLIYYEAGSFKARINEQIEIDDPPINITEYAKIKDGKIGKYKFTLFFGETNMGFAEGAMSVIPAPEEEMEKLMKVLMYEEEKNASGPVNVFLYASDGGKFEIDLMRNPELLYSMYSNGQEQLIGDVFVSNESKKALKKVQFEANFTSDILGPVNVLLGDVPAGEDVSFEVDDPPIDIEKLERLTEIETCTATYKLSVNGKAVAESNGKITICPFNQWNAAMVLLPAYMTPNHPNIISLLQNASKWMLVNGMSPSLEGYQGDKARVEEMVRAVYNAVRDSNIVYSNPPASFFGPQRIRLCEDIVEQKFATCLDMTILFASCLESFGLHPMLITAPGHIFAGVWLNGKSHLSEPIISDANLILKYISDGELVAIECTAMNLGRDISYLDAKTIANKTILDIIDNNDEHHEAIDVQIARAIGVKPLPIRKAGKGKAEQQFVPASTQTPAKAKAESKSKTESKQKAEPSPIAKSYSLEDYKAYNGDLSHISADNFYERQNKKILKEAIAEIVEVEGPISQAALIKTLVAATSLGRASKQISEHIAKLVATADVRITRQNGVRFLWQSEMRPERYLIYRSRLQRSPEDICKFEMKNAVCYLIQENGPMAKDEITKAMVGLFGFARTSKNIEEGAIAAIKAARDLKEIAQNKEKKYVLI